MRELTKIILIIFVFEVAIFFIASAIPINNSSLVSQFNSTESQILNYTYFQKVFTIFTHNLTVAAMELIPAVGLIVLGISIYSTGAVLSAFSSSLNVSGLLAALSLMTLPHSWLELPSYAIAAGSGLYIIIKPREWFRGVLTMTMVPIELFLAALVESGEFYTNPYLLWLYSIPAFVFLYFYYQTMQRISDNLVRNKQGTINTVASQQQSQIPTTPVVDYLTKYTQAWNTGSYYESQGNLLEAMRYYWEGLFYLLTATGMKLGMPSLSKEDYDNIVRAVSYKVGNPQLYEIYNQAFKIRVENKVDDFPTFKNYVSEIIRFLHMITQ
ncbi:hypothetical protein BFU36_06800 [Sulfolobus sp. A20]|nr:hypothetical protein BFU36_06800 [Sulfolobus sp. A20]TRM80732.1 stage II sporulation protein M [Sulfolobus sp. D5]TRM87664.1 stage II sporulation protein M [Sulfolobus sp. C3]TRN00687.1 stage II sporulation protein M [Sulfolobus sp. E1]TRN03430.1 stage II sporulation protein M [Sulfolobus sp. F1]